PRNGVEAEPGGPRSALEAAGAPAGDEIALDHPVQIVHEPPPDEDRDDGGDHVGKEGHAAQEIAAGEALVEDEPRGSTSVRFRSTPRPPSMSAPQACVRPRYLPSGFWSHRSTEGKLTRPMWGDTRTGRVRLAPRPRRATPGSDARRRTAPGACGRKLARRPPRRSRRPRAA